MANLDTRNANASAWLVKVPAALAGQWRAICDQSFNGLIDDAAEPCTLGSIITEEGTGPEGDISYIELPDSMVEAGLPRRFKLQRTPLPSGEDNKMHAISYEAPADKGKEVAKARVDATVRQRLDMMPVVKGEQGQWVLDAKYLEMVRMRTTAACEKTRIVERAAEDEAAHMKQLQSNKRANKESQQHNKRAAETAKADNAKQPKLDNDALEGILFKLFERAPAWPFKALAAETRQPMAHLKAVLDGIAVQQKRGPNKDKYELKPEYRRAKLAGAVSGLLQQQQH